jgi:hypothetical protein
MEQVKATTYPSHGEVPGGPQSNTRIRIDVVTKPQYPSALRIGGLQFIERHKSQAVNIQKFVDDQSIIIKRVGEGPRVYGELLKVTPHIPLPSGDVAWKLRWDSSRQLSS